MFAQVCAMAVLSLCWLGLAALQEVQQGAPVTDLWQDSGIPRPGWCCCGPRWASTAPEKLPRWPARPSELQHRYHFALQGDMAA